MAQMIAKVGDLKKRLQQQELYSERSDYMLKELRHDEGEAREKTGGGQ